MVHQASIDHGIAGFDVIVRESEGFVDFHYGRSFDKSVTPVYNCGPYTADVDGVKTVVQNHFWGTERWFDITPVTVTDIKFSPTDLIAQNLVPPYGVILDLPASLPAPGSSVFDAVREIASDETGYEPTTGGRGAIGDVTDEEAEWLLTGDARNMLEDARGVQGQDIWYWDESTGKLIDIVAKPFVTAYYDSAQGGPPNWLGPFAQNPQDIRPIPAVVPPVNVWTVDTAHMMEVCGIVAMATLAPRYVRSVQARMLRGFYEDNAPSGIMGFATVIGRQMRGTAWLLRELFYAYWATVMAEQAGTLPADCLPSTTLKQMIDNQETIFWAKIATTQEFKNFGIWSQGNLAWWQCDMLGEVLGMYAAKWPATWGPIYIASLKHAMARTNCDGLNQWPIANPVWYWVDIYSDSLISGGVVKSGNVPFADFRALWQGFSSRQISGTEPSGNLGQLNAAQLAILNNDPTNGDTFINPQYGEYFSWLYSEIAYAVYLDRGVLAGAISKVYPNLEGGFSVYHSMMVKLGGVLPQCSVSVTPIPVANLPAPPVVQPPVTQPPVQGDPPMSSTGSNPNAETQLAALTAAVKDITTKEAALAAASFGINTAVQHCITKMAALAAAATSSGTGIDPTAVTALITELQSDSVKINADTTKVVNDAAVASAV